MNPQDIADEFAHELAQFMLRTFTRYEGYETIVADCLLNNLGAYVAIVSKDPRQTLESMGELLKLVDYQQIRADHYGYKLGVQTGIEKAKPGDVIQLGMHRGKPRNA